MGGADGSAARRGATPGGRRQLPREGRAGARVRRRAAGRGRLETPPVDAEILVCARGRDRAVGARARERELARRRPRGSSALVARREAREPLAYVLGEWGFRRLTLRVDRRVLVPRPRPRSSSNAASPDRRPRGAARPRRRNGQRRDRACGHGRASRLEVTGMDASWTPSRSPVRTPCEPVWHDRASPWDLPRVSQTARGISSSATLL